MENFLGKKSTRKYWNTFIEVIYKSIKSSNAVLKIIKVFG